MQPKTKDEITFIRSQLFKDIQISVDLVEKSVISVLKRHKWEASKKFENDRVLDAYSLYLKEHEETKFYFKKLKASRSPFTLFSWLQEYSSSFAKTEKNLKRLGNLIKKDT